MRIKQRTEPCMTPPILEKIALRGGLFFMYRESLDNTLKYHYNRIRNEIEREIKQTKADYLRSSFNDNMGKP